MAQQVEDLKVWQRAREFCVAVNALLGRAGFQRDRKLREQLSDAVDSVISNIAEGFAQPTDRAFARFLYMLESLQRGGSNKATARLRSRLHYGHELAACNEVGDEVARMTTGLIKYLVKSDRRDRGLGPSQRAKRR